MKSKILSIILAITLLCSICVVSVSARESKTVKMLCYNVAGLPSISGIMGVQGADIRQNQKNIGKQVNIGGYDVVAVQEDFGYHSYLEKEMKSFKYKTDPTGGVPGGDGLNIFSKTQIYNTRRITWEKAYGVINDGADELTPKGILYSVLDFGNGIYVDFYDIHADANSDAGSVAARNDNFRQLLEVINKKNSKRPVIITGDFNTSVHRKDGDMLFEYLIKNGGFKDAWIETKNGGDYSDFSAFEQRYDDYFGNWDSLEKFLYRDGGGVKVNAVDFSYIDYQKDGVSLSDHSAASATFSFTKTSGFVPNTEKLRVVKQNVVELSLKKITCTLTDLSKILSRLDELIELLK